MSTVAIIITNWNCWEQVGDLLQTLHKDNYFEIHVVDNDSSDPCPFEFTSFPSVSFHLLGKNTGYAHACNLGFAQSQSPWVMFLNPDVLIAPTEIKKWIEQAERGGLLASSPKSLDARYSKPLPTVWSLLVEFTWLHRVVPDIQATQTLIGGALLIKRDIYFAMGGFDERFFLWFEDSDLTKRLHNLSIRFGRIPIEWVHSGGSSFRGLTGAHQKNLFFHAMDVYMRKHCGQSSRALLSFFTRRFHDANLLPASDDGVSIVVPNANSQLLSIFVEKNLPSLAQVSEYVIVSSSLTAASLWNYRKRYPNVRWIQIDRNYGFAQTVNIGLRACRSTILGTQNDDTQSDGTWIEKCARKLTSGIGSVNPVIYSSSGAIESAGVVVLPRGKAVPIRNVSESIRVDATNAAAVLYSQKALEKVGLFDERFGSYLEDIDLSLRLLRSGFQNCVCIDASVVHIGQSTSKKMKWRKNWLDLKNWTLVIFKNSQTSQLLRNFPMILIERARNVAGLIRALLS